MVACESLSTAPARAYTVGTAVSMVVYVTVLFAVSWAADAQLFSGPALWAVAALPGLPIVAQLAVTLRYLEQADEFVRALTAKRFIVGASLTFAGFTIWGFMEQFAGAPHVSGWWTYAVFWALMGVASCFIKSTR